MSEAESGNPSDGVRSDSLNWIRTGPEGSIPVVLIHAVGLDLTYWDRQVEFLRSDYNVVAFDLPGHGRSAGGPGDCSFATESAVVADLVESIGSGPVHLVGLSVGGMIAQSTALANPGLVRSLSLIATASRFPEPTRAGMRERAATIREHGMGAVLEATLQRWFTPRTRLERPELINRVSKIVLAGKPAVQEAMWEMVAGLNVYDRLGEVQCPTLVLVGEQDPSTPPAIAAEMAEAIAGARLTVLPGASHMLPLETPDRVNAELREFLTAS